MEQPLAHLSQRTPLLGQLRQIWTTRAICAGGAGGGNSATGASGVGSGFVRVICLAPTLASK
ncbi:MAG: hypothetical protein MI924_20875 [Chloroflexales bacterium]|nr:hypothetical protein [Chloroflexales bacterium]